MPVWNHIGHHVADLERSITFYVNVFGFTVRNRLAVPDAGSAKLLRVKEPVGLTAVYLTLGGAILELLHFDREGNEAARIRPFTEPGLTHISLTVDDIAETCKLVLQYGGEVLEDTDMWGKALMIRDPDGQVIEILAPGTL
jgi:catechol 2,3-dioxygenase-like lactoylglutathione lyase family enzyme